MNVISTACLVAVVFWPATLSSTSLSLDPAPAPTTVTETEPSSETFDGLLACLDRAYDRHDWERFCSLVDNERLSEIQSSIGKTIRELDGSEQVRPILEVFNVRNPDDFDGLQPGRVCIQLTSWAERIRSDYVRNWAPARDTKLQEVREDPDLLHVLYGESPGVEDTRSGVVTLTGRETGDGWFFVPNIDLDVETSTFIHAMAVKLGRASPYPPSAPPQALSRPLTENRPPDDPRLVVGEVKAPVLEHKVNPRYPEAARLARLAGKVVLEVIVEVDGSISAVRVLREPEPDFGLALAAEDAVRLWHYKPATLDDKPVRVFFTVIVDYTLR